MTAPTPYPRSSSTSNRISLTRPQMRVFQSLKRFRVLVAGRRFGKTFLALAELLTAVYGKPDTIAWYLGPDRKQAKRIVWKPLKRATKLWWAKRPNESELIIELRGGGMIQVLGAKDYDSLRGPGLDFAVLDEYAQMSPLVWTEVVRPMLSDRGRDGHALFIGSPAGLNHFYTLHGDACDPTNAGSWAAFKFTTLEGGNVRPEEIEAARRDLDEKTFRQEYEASFETYAGRMYYAFSRATNVANVEFNPNYPVLWAMDFNVTPLCSVICQRIGATLNIIDEIVLLDSGTLSACNEFRRRTIDWRQARRASAWDEEFQQGPLPVIVYGDPAGQARHTGADKTDHQQVKEFFRRSETDYAMEWRIDSAPPRVKARVTATNARLTNYNGQHAVFVNPRCKKTIADLEQVIWKLDGNRNVLPEPDKTNPDLTHLSDALSYLVWHEWPIRGRVGDIAQQVI